MKEQNKAVAANNAAQEATSPAVQLDRNEVLSRISEKLAYMGCPTHIKGYRFIRYAIWLGMNDLSVFDMMTKRLYPDVARHFNTTGSRVERAIRHAVEVMYDRCDPEILHKFFGNTISSERGKPTNSHFLSFFADKLLLEMNRAV